MAPPTGSTIKGARERARAEITAEITAEARRQLAVEGAAGLSLRAVARQLGMVSSGIYRYVANRDELLTMLIIEAYEALGDAVEGSAAATVRQPPAVRFAAAAARGPGAGRSPTPTSTPSSTAHRCPATPPRPTPRHRPSRVTLALAGIVADAHRAGLVDPPAAVPVDVTPALRADLDRVREALEVDVPDQVVVRLLAAWTQLFGLVSFELFGQTRNAITAHDDLLDATATAMARLIGLT